MLSLEQGYTAKQLNLAYRNACVAELEALKPGNVHIFADGHGMVVEQFLQSAEVSAPLMTQPELTLGERIYYSVQATITQVKCNTNLGIILLCAPVIQALLTGGLGSLQQKLQLLITQSTLVDADYVYRAIRLANPAGLGKRERHDIQQTPQINLLSAMRQVENEDSIAQQYCNGFEQVLAEALPQYHALLQQWQKPAWAATGLYIYWLAHYLDSHIVRKFGLQTAQAVHEQARVHFHHFIQLDNPKTFMPILLAWDKALKAQNLNPGTSADLTVVTLLLACL